MPRARWRCRATSVLAPQADVLLQHNICRNGPASTKLRRSKHRAAAGAAALTMIGRCVGSRALNLFEAPRDQQQDA